MLLRLVCEVVSVSLEQYCIIFLFLFDRQRVGSMLLSIEADGFSIVALKFEPCSRSLLLTCLIVLPMYDASQSIQSIL